MRNMHVNFILEIRHGCNNYLSDQFNIIGGAFCREYTTFFQKVSIFIPFLYTNLNISGRFTPSGRLTSLQADIRAFNCVVKIESIKEY